MQRKFILSFGAFLLIVGQTRSADEIFQAKPEEIEKQRKEKLDYLKKTVRDPYETVGKRNPKWDAEARKALDAVSRYWANSSNLDDLEGCWEHARNAVNAGCDDPFILYLYARYARSNFEPNFVVKLNGLYDKVVSGMPPSRYSAFRKAMTLTKAVVFWIQRPNPTPEELKKYRSILDQAAALLPEVAKNTSPFAQSETYDLANDLFGAYYLLSKDYKASFDKIAPALQKDPRNQDLFLVMKAEFHIRMGWEARGTGLASTVTEQGWKGLREQVALAEADLERAWKSTTRNRVISSKIAVKMITVELAQGKGRDRMEMWFRRAMEADSDNMAAIESKLGYLEPKWHGTAADMLEFAEQCKKTQNREAGFPMVILGVHKMLAEYLPPEKKPGYFAQPQVWKDFQSFYEEELKRFPESKFNRTSYAFNAMLCGQYAEANRQFEILKDNYSRFIYPEEDYRRVREEARLKSGGGK